MDGDIRVCRSARVPRARNGLFVITDAAAQFTDLGYKTDFWKGRRSSARLWKQVRPNLSDLTFRVLSPSIDCRTIRVPAGVLKAPNVRTGWNSLRTREEFPIRHSETEWV